MDTISSYIEMYEYNLALNKLKSLMQGKSENQLNSQPDYYYNYAKILKGLGKADSSYYYLLKVEPLILSKKNSDSILMLYTLKAEVSRYDLKKYLTDKNIKVADNFYNKYSDFQFNPNALAYYFNRKAACLNQFHFGNTDTLKMVIDLSDKVVNLKSKIKDKSLIAYSMNEKAQVFQYHFDSIKSIDYYKEAFLFADNNNLDVPKVDIAINLAMNLFRDNKKNNEAIKVLEDSFPVANKNGQLTQIRDVAMHLSFLYSEKGLYKLALKFKEIQRETQYKLLTLQKESLINESEYQQKLIIQSNQIKAKDKEVNVIKKYLLSVFIVVFLLLFGGLLLKRHNKKIKVKNEILKQLSEENKFLLSEANHRINNNLQLIIILISDQLKKLPKDQQGSLNDILSKVDSIATLHRHLYKNMDKSKICIKKYLNEILVNFNPIFKTQGISLRHEIQSFSLSADTSMYLGLLLTELCVNSIKHAFKEVESKNITFILEKRENEINFIYFDSGIGIKNKAIKIKLIERLCRQLKVEYKIEGNNGFKFSFIKRIENVN